ncbi:hypothetical protein SAMN05216338_10507 [Bradyrhizobium sp. Rc2d]|nr:hypothetical protein SAMN05216338_10507 [Bradyrhizobium sp. Rc2d]
MAHTCHGGAIALPSFGYCRSGTAIVHLRRGRMISLAEPEIPLESRGDLGVISDGSPVICDEHSLWLINATMR